MQVSLRWLNDYIDLRDLTVDDISKTLTSIGLEVDAIKALKPLTGEVLVGKILKAEQHPNADKLRLTQVDVGRAEPLTIVCGAPNARAGIKVAVATIGAELPGDFKIKESKIRGEKSFGMLCSEKELGISEASDGIIELPESAAIGTSIADYFQLEDTLIEIGLTPNRSDCLGAIGVARDLAAKLGKTLKLPQLSQTGVDEALDTAQHLSVQIEDEDCSRRFVGLYVEGVAPIASPQWLQRRLTNAGMRPINLLVDATNYVMLETAQPIHAYDVRDIGGAQIKVRHAKAGESLKTLDNQDRKLQETDIVIADANKAIGLAGVMGGANSEVKDDTKALIIEVAHFNPSRVRKSSKRFGLHTEASHRFERGIDIENLSWVARRVADLIVQGIAEAKAFGTDSLPTPRVAGKLVDVYPQPFRAPHVDVRLARVKSIVGVAIGTTDATKILDQLGCRILQSNDVLIKVASPSWRHDLEREIDFIEEIARIHGYDKIPLSLPKMDLVPLPEHPLIDFIDTSKQSLAQIGLHETISFPFMGLQDLEALRIGEQHPLSAAVKLMNPLVEQHRFMRTSLSVGLIQALAQNRRHGLKGSRLFELARSFHEPKLARETTGLWSSVGTQGGHISDTAQKDDRVIERTRVAAILDAQQRGKSWDRPEETAGFYQIKSLLVQWLGGLGIRDLRFEALTGTDVPWLHPGAAAGVWAGETYLGWLGELHPLSVKAYDLDHAPSLFELDLEAVLKTRAQEKSFVSGNLRFPPVTRDVALLVSKDLSYAAFMKSFVSFKKRKYLREQKLFDIYEGQNLPAGKKSMAFSLVFQANDKTLTDAEIDKELEALLGWLKDDLSAEQR